MRSHEERKEELVAIERRCVLLVSEGDKTRAALESAERSRKALETELQDANEKYSDLNNQVLPCVSLLWDAVKYLEIHTELKTTY